jgi:hypothetical protein
MTPIGHKGLQHEMRPICGLEGNHGRASRTERLVDLHEEASRGKILYHAGVPTSIRDHSAGDALPQATSFSPIELGNEPSPHPPASFITPP